MGWYNIILVDIIISKFEAGLIRWNKFTSEKKAKHLIKESLP